MKEYLKKIDKEVLIKILFISYALLPVLELDYLVYDVLNQFGLPLPSTIFHYLWFPLLMVLTYAVLEKKKRKVFVITASLGFVCLAYFVAHHMVVKDLFDVLYLTNRYIYSLAHEFSYYATILIPLLFVYVIVKLKPSIHWLNCLVVVMCLCISVPIFLGNIFEFGRSTYVGNVKANIFTWFTGIYDVYHPREVCSKFYFPEGNTIGILMFALYPLLIKVFLQAKKRWLLFPLLVIHGLAMIMLGTRVSTYGSMLSICAVLAVCAFLFVFMKNKYNVKALLALCVLLCAFVAIFPYSPAKVNQDMAVESQFSVGEVDEELKKEIGAGAGNLIPGTAEFNYHYIYIFEDQKLYKFLTFPDTYYTWVYPYEIDAKFYVDLAVSVPFEQRADGRDFEKYFFNYKWQNLEGWQKLFGFSYSMFMNGGITLEQDFVVIKYMYGYLGMLVMVLPWLSLLAVIVVKALLSLKKSLNIDVLIMGISVCAMYASGYMSGHVMDEYLTSFFIALLLGMLINAIWSKGVDAHA